jgi:hypothetical protein
VEAEAEVRLAIINLVLLGTRDGAAGWRTTGRVPMRAAAATDIVAHAPGTVALPWTSAARSGCFLSEKCFGFFS